MDVPTEPLDPLRLLVEVWDSARMSQKQQDLLVGKVRDLGAKGPTDSRTVAMVLLEAMREAGVLCGDKRVRAVTAVTEYDDILACQEAMDKVL